MTSLRAYHTSDDTTEAEIGNIVEASNLIDRAIEWLSAVYEGTA